MRFSMKVEANDHPFNSPLRKFVKEKYVIFKIHKVSRFVIFEFKITFFFNLYYRNKSSYLLSQRLRYELNR